MLSSRPRNEPISASVYFRDAELYGTETDKKVEWLGGSLGGAIHPTCNARTVRAHLSRLPRAYAI